MGTNGEKILELPANWPVDWPEYESVFHMKQKLDGLVEGVSFWERANTTCIGAMTHDELKMLYDDKSACLSVMSHIFKDYAAMYEELLVVEEKLDRATVRIRDMNNELVALKNERTLN